MKFFEKTLEIPGMPRNIAGIFFLEIGEVEVIPLRCQGPLHVLMVSIGSVSSGHEKLY
jgi:hypothetical protein